jgi:hypothetical protein
MADPIKGLLRFGRAVFDRIEETMKRVADDPAVQAALEADLGLPPGSLDAAKEERQPLTGIEEYIEEANPSAAQLEVAFDAIQSYVRFWTTVFKAAKTEDPSVVVDEVLYRLLETTTVDLVRMEYPTFYAVMRLLRVFEHDVRLVAEDLVNPEVPANLFTEEYWEGWETAFRRNYLRFRLEQRGAILEDEDADTTAQRQVGYEVFWRSDAILLGSSLALLVANKIWDLEKLTNTKLDIYYGWELPPRPPPAPCPTPEPAASAPLSEHIASRGSTVRVTVPAGLAESASATITQFLFHDADDRLGWLFSLRGDVTFAGQTESKERPLRIGGKIQAPTGLDLLVRFSGPDRLKVVGGNVDNPVGALQLFARPAESATHGPAFFIPDPTGTRLEIGDFSFSVDVSAEGMKVRAAAHKSAFVLEPGDTDAFVGKALKSKATRVDFDIGLTVDNEHGLYLDGGGRLAMTIPVNGSILRSVQLSLAREASAPGSEARFEAVASMRFNLGFMVVSVEQIGFTFGIGSARDNAPSDAHELLGPLLYLRQLGFRHPSGVGILVDAGVVTGGGFLGYDEEHEEYSGVVQLQLGGRVSLKAIGLVTTKLPDGRRDFSMLLIASVEFDPPLGPILWVSLAGVGVIVGINRTLDADALRAGLRNRVLDDILFPPDPVANAARLVAAVRGVFPPAADRHIIGISLKLGIGTPPWLTAELALVVEFGGGETRRVALMGQLHAGLPRGSPKKILELHVDGVGIWDLEHDEFSLDARIYDSRLAFATLAGDVAIRKRDREADRYVLISAGGYHPEFPVPAAFPKLDRLRISLVDTDLVKLTLTAYLAFTPNTKQFGAKIDLRVGGSSFSLEATLGFDALFTEDVGFVVDFDLEIKLKFKGRTLFGVDVYGRLTGSEPKHVSGEWSIDLWLTSISRSFDHTFGSERPPAALPPVDPLPPLLEALQDGRNWAANLPRRNRTLVTLRERPGGGQVLLHPLGGLEVRQAVVPLGIKIDRFSGAPLASARRFDITRVTVGGQQVGEPPSVDDLFAAAEFLELNDDEKLARPSFETMKAGVAVQAAGLAAGAAIASEMDFDDIIFGPGGPFVRGTTKGTVTGPAASLAAIFGPAGRSALRTTGPGRFAAAPLGAQLRRQDYVLARTDDLTPADGAPATSFTVARQALDTRRAADPRAAHDLQVVAAFHTEAPA